MIPPGTHEPRDDLLARRPARALFGKEGAQMAAPRVPVCIAPPT